jgi:hypothetical protein
VVEYVEVTFNSGFYVDVMGLTLLEAPSAVVLPHIETMAEFDKSDPEVGVSYIFPSLEMSLWRPHITDNAFSTLGLGRLGYYSHAT